jgi:hypothetical protein
MHDKDAWGCGFCATLLTTWEERCEHIALHFEEKGGAKWNFTNVILGLLKQSDAATAWNNLLTQRHGDEQNWPKLSWESKKCNRLRYKLETKWHTSAFDMEKLVQDTYDLAEIEPKDVVDSAPEMTPDVSEPDNSAHSEIVEFKLETSDFGNDARLPSSHGVPQDQQMMDLDPVEPQQVLHHQQSFQQSQWPVSADMSQAHLTTDTSMGAYGGYNPTMATMSASFTQPIPQQSFHHQQTWPNTDFVSTPDLINFQQPTSYMTYTRPNLSVCQFRALPSATATTTPTKAERASKFHATLGTSIVFSKVHPQAGQHLKFESPCYAPTTATAATATTSAATCPSSQRGVTRQPFFENDHAKEAKQHIATQRE